MDFVRRNTPDAGGAEALLRQSLVLEAAPKPRSRHASRARAEQQRLAAARAQRLPRTRRKAVLRDMIARTSYEALAGELNAVWTAKTAARLKQASKQPSSRKHKLVSGLDLRGARLRVVFSDGSPARKVKEGLVLDVTARTVLLVAPGSKKMRFAKRGSKFQCVDLPELVFWGDSIM